MFDVIDAMNACVNLGNWLEAPNQDWGVICDESDIVRIAEMGFDTIRMPVRWETRAMDTAPYTIDEDFFELVDDALTWAEDAGLTVVINMHHHDAFLADALGRKDQFLAMWEQIASRYKDRPSSVIFEIMNEPHDTLTEDLWNEYLVEALAVIRVDNPTRPVVIGPADWGHVSGMDQLILPDDPNIIFTVHYYDPLEFTHQGASWVEGSDEWLGNTWEGTDLERSAIRDEFDFVAAWADENNVPVFMGEFGAYNRADMDSRALWTDAVARLSEEMGFAWCYWEYKGDFGVWDQSSEAWNTPLTDVLLSTVRQ
jgi:endoglucanase